MKKILIATSLLLAVFTFPVSGQINKITITGKVISFDESFPLEGVSILVKGTKNNTGTQSDGSFSLSVSPEDKILEVSYDGYESQEVKLTNTRDYEIVLRKKNSLTGKAVLTNKDTWQLSL